MMLPAFKAELADLKAKVASMEAVQMTPAAGGDAESLTSMNKAGAIKIGGSAVARYTVVNFDSPYADTLDDAANKGSQEDDEVVVSNWGADADLFLDIRPADNAVLKMRLKLNDAQNVNSGLLEEVYFQFTNVLGAPSYH